MDTHHEAEILFFIGNREPIFDKNNSRADDHALEIGNSLVKFFYLLFRTKAHNPFNASPIVPAAIEQDYFPSCRQVLDVALKIPLGFFTLGGRG